MGCRRWSSVESRRTNRPCELQAENGRTCTPHLHRAVSVSEFAVGVACRHLRPCHLDAEMLEAPSGKIPSREVCAPKIYTSSLR